MKFTLTKSTKKQKTTETKQLNNENKNSGKKSKHKQFEKGPGTYVKNENGNPIPFISDKEEVKLYDNLEKNLQFIKDNLQQSPDLKEKRFTFGTNSSYTICAVYIDGLSNSNLISHTVFEPLYKCSFSNLILHDNNQVINKINTEILWASESKVAGTFNEVFQAILVGDTALLLEGSENAILINTKGGDRRSITEPESESVVRGPREGFTENFRTNTALIRRKIKNAALTLEEMTIGRKTQTLVGVMYMKNIAKQDVVDLVKKRLQTLDVESILESGYIEQYIEDHPFSIFPTIDYSEKPDIIAAKLLEGRVAIIVEGTPFVLTVPMLFVESFQTNEDYYNKPVYASSIKILRIIAYLVSIYAPGIFIALTNFHPELIPTKLLLSIISAKSGTPFPIYIETLIMVIAYEFLREAGIRLPKSVGQAISIVGALIMGEAAVTAGIVGAPIVIVVAFTAVCGFIIPEQNNSTTILRILIIIVATVLGWFGIVMSLYFLLTYLSTLHSFGIPYFDSISNIYDVKDSVIRLPLWADARRPVNIAGKDKFRTGAKTTIGKREDTKKYVPENSDKENSSKGSSK